MWVQLGCSIVTHFALDDVGVLEHDAGLGEEVNLGLVPLLLLFLLIERVVVLLVTHMGALVAVLSNVFIPSTVRYRHLAAERGSLSDKLVLDPVTQIRSAYAQP